MSIKLISNYLFNAKDFLDSRQALAESIEDLKIWDFDKYPIPNGFEVCIDGTWYTYKQNEEPTEELGYFQERSAKSRFEDEDGGLVSRPDDVIYVGDIVGFVEEDEDEGEEESNEITNN